MNIYFIINNIAFTKSNRLSISFKAYNFFVSLWDIKNALPKDPLPNCFGKNIFYDFCKIIEIFFYQNLFLL